VPAYVPPRFECEDRRLKRSARVVLGGVSVYLLARFPWLRHVPRGLFALLDSPWLLRLVAGTAVRGDPEELGRVALAVLEGITGAERPELLTAADWLATHVRPEVVVLPNLMLASLAPALRSRSIDRVVAFAAGEAPFIDRLGEPYNRLVWQWIGRWTAHLDRVITFSHYYKSVLSARTSFHCPLDVAPLPIDVPSVGRSEPDRLFRVLYLSRVVPEKGLRILGQAVRLAAMRVDRPIELHIAGSGGSERVPEVREVLDELHGTKGVNVQVHGEVERDRKLSLLRSSHVWVLPTTVADSQNVACLEALAVGTPVVVPATGWYPELLDRTRGGVLVQPGNAQAFADVLQRLIQSPQLRVLLGNTGREQVRKYHSVDSAGEAIRALLIGDPSSDRPNQARELEAREK